ncbi:MFS transporter [Metabacillus sp. 113a]|uniref:MFS transporter n=1 Tax=Metabacillus sp. 113a TaxID=3404706 RepID=UPI003CED57CA
MGEHAYRMGGIKPGLKKNKEIHKLLSSNFISFFGDQIYLIAVPLMVLSLSGSAIMMGLAAAAERLPVLMQPAAGVLADRMDRRKLLLICDFGRFVLTGLLGILFLAEALPLWVLFCGAFSIGVFSQVYQTAQFAYVPNLVNEEDLAAVNSINSAILNTSVLMAPAAGGLVISLYSPGAGLIINSLSFLAAFAAVAGISVPAAGVAKRSQSFWKDANEGFHFVLKTKPLFYTNLALLLSVFGTTLFLTILIFHLKDTIRLSVFEIGILLSFSGAGAIGGSLMAGYFNKRASYRKLLFFSSFTGGISIVLFGFTGTFWLLVLLNSAGTAAASIMNPCIATLRQNVTPDHLMGRVQATSRLMTWSLMPGAAFLAGLIAEGLGTSAVIIIGGMFSAAASAVYVKAGA